MVSYPTFLTQSDSDEMLLEVKETERLPMARSKSGRISTRNGRYTTASNSAETAKTLPYFARFSSIFHTQSLLLKVPSRTSSINFPMRGCQPIVAPIVNAFNLSRLTLVMSTPPRRIRFGRLSSAPRAAMQPRRREG
jgi:hypothetical protein